jgi:hypothetical protein
VSTVPKPAFLISIDTEGDNQWEDRSRAPTENARFLPRFQALCEKHGLRPTWLANHEMAVDPRFVEFGRDLLERDAGEIGMHLHAWNSPPVDVTVSEDDARHATYLIDYPEAVIGAKVRFMTGLLEDTFGVKMHSHRAGRWAMDERYAQALVACGYRLDCSVTPGLSWRHHAGAPGKAGGSDYRRFPRRPYFVDLDDIARAGNSGLLEVPMTTYAAAALRLLPDRRRVAELGHRLSVWLRPVGTRRDRARKALRRSLAAGDDFAMFMLHSSELMPGGSPTFRTATEVEDLYVELERLFELAAATCTGMTLAEYRARYDRA